MSKKLGTLFVVAGPSGSGKSSIIRKMLELFPGELVEQVTHTTREPRPGEIPGKDYVFESRASFMGKVAEGFFLEHATVHGNLYGTPMLALRKKLETGLAVIMDIDIQGAAQVRGCPDSIIKGTLTSVFVTVSDPQVLRRRIEQRPGSTPESTERRMSAAVQEIAEASKFHHVIVNDELCVAVDAMEQIIKPQLRGAFV
jgi:guanylate kinase